MDKMLALSLLRDEDYDDLVIPKSQYADLLAERSNPQPAQPFPAPAAPLPKSAANEMQVPSVALKSQLQDGTPAGTPNE